MIDHIESDPNKRTLHLTNGNKVHVERQDPYGFWYVHYDKGPMPDQMTGAYTTYDQAEKAVVSYLKNKTASTDIKVETENASHRIGRDRK